MKRISQLTPLTAVTVFILRLGILPPNVSAVGSFGFFGKSFPLFLAVILAFDYFIGGYYSGYLFTYAGFMLYPLLAKVAGNSTKKQVILLPLASFLFFLVSNFGVWLYWYPNTIEGLIKCYSLALPFYKNTLLGDIFFGWGYMVVRHLGISDRLGFSEPQIKVDYGQ